MKYQKLQKKFDAFLLSRVVLWCNNKVATTKTTMYVETTVSCCASFHPSFFSPFVTVLNYVLFIYFLKLTYFVQLTTICVIVLNAQIEH